MSVLLILNELKATSSKKEKEAILVANKDNDVLRSVVYYAYEPTLNYFQSSIKEHLQEIEGCESIEHSFSLLNDLADRKFTGNGARLMLESERCLLNSADKIVLDRIIKRDLRCGINVKTINKIWPNLITKWPYMRCSLTNEKTLKNFTWPALSEEKLDGMFVNITVTYGEVGNYSVHFNSRNGTELLNVPSHIVEEFRMMSGYDVVYHGEGLVTKDGVVLPREIGNGILNSMLHGGELPDGHDIKFVLWDVIPLEDYKNGKCGQNREYRLNVLSDLIEEFGKNVELVKYRIVNKMQEAMDHYQKIVSDGGEGTILKDMNSIWKDGTSTQQLKMKVEVECDLKIVGFFEGNGKNADTFGSLICQSEDGLLEVKVSGFTDKKRKELWESKNDIIGKIITVKSNSIMNPSESNSNYSLFLPRFVEDRFMEKDAADTLERIQEMFATAMMLK